MVSPKTVYFTLKIVYFTLINLLRNYMKISVCKYSLHMYVHFFILCLLCATWQILQINIITALISIVISVIVVTRKNEVLFNKPRISQLRESNTTSLTFYPNVI